jgi:hypothetical protein
MPKNYASSLQGLSQLLNVCTATIQKWATMDGFPSKNDTGYNPDEVASWVVNNKAIKPFLRNKVSDAMGIESQLEDDIEQEFASNSNTGSPSLERYRAARAAQEELKLAVQRKELVKLDEYVQAEAARYAQFKTNLEQLTFVLPPRLENLNQNEIMKELQTQFDQLLLKLQREIK